ncbi:BA14K family protein [Methylobacterium currus]|uniref:Lectin-like protein BA14k n=1 Tax=Methylobacterium currus TaxID=2051553 RepID=A0A2R4WIS9_9HYPH|nr:BA14K family protein [Methylobacterium currus]AWB21452.1 BA14K family protein [Methylobacterium currus]
MKLSLVIAATVAAMVAGSPASAAPAGTTAGAALLRGDLPTEFSQYRRFGRPYGYRRGYGVRRGYGYRRGPGVGAAVGAGVAGLAAGAIIGGAIANSQSQAAPVVVQGGPDPETVAACARRFRSYDPASGTYLSNDGTRRPCP